MADLPPLPSMQGLRVLDAAVRTRSFTEAASELGLTHGAVSQQIRALEGRIGARLFTRKGARMEPTPEALAIAARTRHALHIIGEAFAKPNPRGGKNRVRLSTTPAIARFWLAPRLNALLAETGVQLLSVDAAPARVDFADGKADCAIRYGPGDWPGVNARLLGIEKTFPVASPALAERIGRAPADIVGAPLIANTFISWRGWLKAAQLPASTPLDFSLETTDNNVSLEAAVNGLGVALARSRFVRPLLDSGALVPLSDIAIDDGYKYFFVWPAGGRRKPAIAALGDWLAREYARESDVLGLPPV
jgi:DNA-binding transcriptional LysR family regulator